MEGGEAPERVKIERRLRRKMLEDPEPRIPAPPTYLRKAIAALIVAGEEKGARASSGKRFQQQGLP